jgi:hypothetical protein
MMTPDNYSSSLWQSDNVFCTMRLCGIERQLAMYPAVVKLKHPQAWEQRALLA